MRAEVRERAVRTRRAARGALWAGANSEVFTKHESRNTNHGLFPDPKHGLSVARLVPVGTEALQSFFSVGGRFRLRVMTPLLETKKPHPHPSGTRRLETKEPPGPRPLRFFTRHETRPLPGAQRKPAQIPRFLRNTRHETRITAFSRHGFVESLPLGTEGLQSFFWSGAGLC